MAETTFPDIVDEEDNQRLRAYIDQTITDQCSSAVDEALSGVEIPTAVDDGRIYVGSGNGCDYELIQEAVTEAENKDGRTVVVTPSYNADYKGTDKESFPVEVTKGITIEGHTRTASRIWLRPGESAFRLREDGIYNDSVTIRDIEFKNGSDVVTFSGMSYFECDGVTFANPNGAAIRAMEDNTEWNNVENVIRDTNVIWGAGHGIVLGSAEANNRTVIDNVSINHVDGHGIVASGAATTIQNSTIQSCGEYAVKAFDTLGLTVRDTYFEKNGRLYASGKKNGYPMDIRVEDSRGACIENCYTYSMGKSKRFAHFGSGENAHIRNIVYNGYEKHKYGGLLVVMSSAEDTDVYESSHSGKAPVFVQDANGNEADYCDSTCSFGQKRKTNNPEP